MTLGHMIMNWHTNTYIKSQRFLAWKFINLLVTQKPLGVQLWNLYAMWVHISAWCKPSFRVPSLMTKILQVENGLRVDYFEPIYLGKCRYWWKMICDFCAHYQLSIFWLCLFNPTWILFFLLFLFFGYLLLNRCTYCIQSLSN